MFNITQVREKSVEDIYKETGKLPDKWQVKKLKDVLRKQPKSRIKASDAKSCGAIPFYNCSKAQTKWVNDKIVTGENIFITTGGQTMYTHYYNGEASYSTDVYCVNTPNEDASYVHNIFESMHEYLQSHFRGFDIKHLDKKSFLEEEVFLPPVEQQRLVSSVLKNQGKMVELLRKNLSNLCLQRQHVEKRLSKLIKSKSKQIIRINDIVTIKNGFPFTKSDFSETKCGLPIIRIRDLKNQTPAFYFNGPVTQRMTVVDNGAILVSMDGDFIATEWNGGKAVVNQRVLVVDTNKPKHFIITAINIILAEINRMTTATTVKHLSTKELLDVTISIPDDASLTKLNLLIGSIESLIKNTNSLCKTENKKLDWLRRQLLSGKFEVTVANESA